MARTELLIKPTIEECVKTAVALEMPEAEGRKFYFYYSSNGWRVGRLQMKSFASAMAGWKERWIEHGGSLTVNGNGNHSGLLSGADKVIRGEEYRRVVDELRGIRGTYGDHQNWRGTDIVRYKKLIERRNQLRVELGIKV